MIKRFNSHVSPGETLLDDMEVEEEAVNNAGEDDEKAETFAPVKAHSL